VAARRTQSPQLTAEYIRRGRRIQKLGERGELGAALFEEARQLADRIAVVCGALDRRDLGIGPEAAADIFQNIGQNYRALAQANRNKGKRAKPHDPERDKILLEMFDESNPDSFFEAAKSGKLPKGGGEYYPPMNKTEFARHLVRLGWGTSPDQLLRHVRDLKKPT
jgi:hypothetical protein